jgi:hypothetical protein
LLHLVIAQGEYEEAAYMGYLFAANFFGSLIAAFGIYHRQRWGWWLGLVIAAGSIAGYIWSRTFGMPGMNVEEWLAPYGVVSLSVEAAFIFVFLLQPKRTTDLPVFKPGYVSLANGLSLVLAIAILTYQWDVTVTRAYGHHVGSLDDVCRTPAMTLSALEETYGIQVSRVAISMLNGVVDVRIKVLDPGKAHDLFQNQAALLVNQQVLILAPHMHSHAGPRLKAGKIFTVFFPTEQTVHSGSEVSLVFGPVRVEPVAVK